MSAANIYHYPRWQCHCELVDHHLEWLHAQILSFLILQLQSFREMTERVVGTHHFCLSTIEAILGFLYMRVTVMGHALSRDRDFGGTNPWSCLRGALRIGFRRKLLGGWLRRWTYIFWLEKWTCNARWSVATHSSPKSFKPARHHWKNMLDRRDKPKWGERQDKVRREARRIGR